MTASIVAPVSNYLRQLLCYGLRSHVTKNQTTFLLSVLLVFISFTYQVLLRGKFFVEIVKSYFTSCVCTCNMGVLKISLQVSFLIDFFTYDIEENFFQVWWTLNSVVWFCCPPLHQKCNGKIYRYSNSRIWIKWTHSRNWT